MKSDRQRIGYHSATDPAAAPAPAPTAAPTGPATKAPVTPPAAPPATTFCVWVQPTKSSAVRAAASPSSFIPIPSSRGECPSARLSESKRGDHRRKLARERQRRKRERERDGEACVQVWLPDITDAWCLLSDAGMMPDPIPEDDRDSSYYGVEWPKVGQVADVDAFLDAADIRLSGVCEERASEILQALYTELRSALSRSETSQRYKPGT